MRKTMKMKHFQALICPKKSQIKMFETIAILFIFFILLGLGIIFYSYMQKGTIEQEKEKVSVLRGIQIVEKISKLPELQCTRDNVPEENCIDIYKLKAASENVGENTLYYFPIFGYSKVELKQIYPFGLGELKHGELYDKQKPDYVRSDATQIPVSIYDPFNDKYSFGILSVEVYT